MLDRRFDEAKKILDKVAMDFPEYISEAKYYSAICDIVIREKNLTDFQESIFNDLTTAKSGFLNKIDFITANISAVETYKTIKETMTFFNDDFLQQQEECLYATHIIIDNIDRFLGQIIEPIDFICEFLSFEASLLVYDRLCSYEKDHSLIDGYKVCKDISIENLEDICFQKNLDFDYVLYELNSLKGSIIDEKKCKELFGELTFQDYWEFFKAQNLLSDIKEKVFIELENLSPSLQKILMEKYVVNDILLPDYWYPSADKWKEINFEKFLDDNELLANCLLKHEIIQKFEIAKLKQDNHTWNFPMPITKKDFFLHHIHPDDVDEIIEFLKTRNYITEDVNSHCLFFCGRYEELGIFGIPKCYRTYIEHLFQKKIMFSVIYLKLLQRSPLNLLDCSYLFYELINNGILEPTNINIKVLQERLPDGSVYDDVSGFIRDKYPVQHYEKAVKYAKHVLKKTVEDPNEYVRIISKTSQKHIRNILQDKASAFYKLKEFDIKQKKFQDFLLDIQLDTDNITSAIHGLPLLITPYEMKLSKETILKLIGISGFGALQIGVGVGLVIAVPGSGALVGKILVEEGLNDVMFSVKGALKGRCEKYLRTKITKGAIHILMTNTFKYLNDSQFILNTDIAAEYYTTENLGSVAENSGKNLFKKIMLELTEIKEIKKKKEYITKILTSSKIFVYKRIRDLFDHIFDDVDKFKEIYANMLSENGINKGLRIIEDEECEIEADIEKTINDCSSAILDDINILNLEESKSEDILNSKSFSTMENRMKVLVEKICIKLQKKIRRNRAGFSVNIDEYAIKQTAENSIDKWKNKLKNICKTTVEEALIYEMDEIQKIKYQNELQMFIKTKKIETNVQSMNEIFAPEVMKLSKNIKLNNLNKQFKKQYYKYLLSVVNETSDASVLAFIAVNTIGRNQIIVDSCARLISSRIQMPLILTIQNEDEFFKLITSEILDSQSNGRNPVSVILEISERNKLLDLLKKRIPHLYFENTIEFENDLVEYIKRHPEFQRRTGTSRQVCVDIDELD